MIGGSGSGKTNVFNLTLDQLRRKKNENDIFIIFDTKGDFLRRFGRGGDMVLGNGRDYRKISSRWNLFDDVLADGNSPDDYELNEKSWQLLYLRIEVLLHSLFLLMRQEIFLQM